MSATQEIAASYISDPGRYESEMKQAFEDLVSLHKETLGGSSASGATVLASDTFSVLPNVCAYALDNEGAAATDNLRWVGGTPRDGQVIFVHGYNAGRIQTIVNAAGGAGQIYTIDGTDFVMRDTRMIIPLRYNLGATAWYMMDFPETFRLNQMPGGKVAATLTMAANAAAPTQALHALDTSGGAAEDLRILTMSTSNRDIQELTLYAANLSHVPTIKHAYGGTGQVYMNDSADYVLDKAWKAITFRRNGNQWNEIWRANMPPSTGRGQVAISDGKGGWEILDFAGATDGDTIKYKGANANKFEIGAASSGGSKWTITAKSANYTMNDASGAFYLNTATSADLVVTCPASPADGTKYKQVLHSGAFKAVLTANGAEVFFFGDHTDTVLNIVPGSAPVELIAVTGGWYVG